MSEIDNSDVLSFMAGMLQVSFDLAKSCPNKEFETDFKTHVVPEWSRLIKYYKNKIQGNEALETEEKID